jgi:6-phosphogluconolactonase (cycloisomerase 2 family)
MSIEQPNNPEQNQRHRVGNKLRNFLLGLSIFKASLSVAGADEAPEKPDFSDNTIDKQEQVDSMEKPEAPKVEIYSYQEENGTAFVIFDRECSVATYEVDASGKEKFVRSETFPAGPAQLNLGGINNGPTYTYKSVDKQGNILSEISFSQNNMEWAKDNAKTIGENPTKEEYVKEIIYNQLEKEGSTEVKNIQYNNEYSEQELNDLREQTERKDKELKKEKIDE